jgi:regulator of protease activity HflC (stomatin/prohibitin superfamily)
MNIANLVQGIAMISWLAVGAVVLVAVVRASRNQGIKGVGTAIILVLVVAILMTTVGAGLVFLQPEERGVVISAFAPKGYREEALQPGLRWVIPFAETVVKYPISKETYTMSIAQQEGSITGDDSVAARTADGQEIYVDASVIFSITPTKVTDVHIAWQDRYTTDLVRPLARGIIRDAVSQYSVEEVVTTFRFEMVSNIRATLEAKLAENGITLVDFVLRNITFSAEYANSVEQKQIAEQQAQQAKFVVESKKQEAEQARQIAQGQADAVVIAARGDAEARLIQAEAEANALELIAAALRDNPDLLTYQYITKLSPNIQVMLLPSGSPFLFPLPDLSNTPVPTPE